jgi:negative regulator of flagellin synthesis FlgM
MKMPIDLKSIDLGGSAPSSTRKASSTQSTAADSSDATQQPESEVSITSTASLLARLQQAMAKQQSVDEQRVDAINKAIANGSYTVHVDRIAEGLIHTERALGQLTEI